MEGFPLEQDGIVLIGEPVTHPDGRQLSLYKVTDGISVHNEGIISFYDDEEVKFVGDGDWSNGLIRIAQEGYQNEPMGGLRKPFAQEIKDAYSQGLL
jgi:hypothetical protein